ncbi:GNAT family N-acetyltransferase [Altererythrobacter arenosus]|uniref:GNAT family N-acetyltransferase n=1 Tax=Altererythrobacter arenosus TaxID=3032592 RepID=A0ABY8FVV3_9SPHN|nr:GNAT family N-acetyltransferase [Altererythrobacter sp. CAU 1644]WFL78862.1 GNAT family N-acetyltransferase [Altererythrobacter sp. CAU 1644]
MSSEELTVKLSPSVGAFDAAEWNALGGYRNPFVSHEFLSALEDSGSVGSGTGWDPVPIVIEDDAGKLLAAMPSYAKGHSQGEYVFDHAWADALERAGGRYYPKLQIAAPFTPANGPRLLLKDESLAPQLLKAASIVCHQNGLSSAHATFIEDAQLHLFEEAGWLMRSDIQFHWHNRGYGCFDDFLGELASRKRRSLRKERAAAQEGVEIVRLTGDDIKPHHWDAFWIFYQDTGARKWGSPYLTREAFSLFGERMADRLVLILAQIEGQPIAGALNFIGSDALYGRYWGCTLDKRFLHFELCYYQAIDLAIELGLDRVEAGAQGGHKLARGYEPVKTWSAHWLANPSFSEAVADFLEREREGVALDQNYLGMRTPFKKG